MNERLLISEAELEAGIARAITDAFPYIAAGNIKHQLTFTITIGRQAIEIDGQAASKASGRCDVLLIHDERPLAILELKRPGTALDEDDRKQGLSYARVLEPWAPLVVVTNGTETCTYLTYSGSLWEPETPNEDTLAELLKRTATLAREDLRQAVEVLLGPRSGAWLSIVRSLSQAALNDLTGPWENSLCPFPENLIFPRKATAYVKHYLQHGISCVMVSGPALCGKSNVLRELTLQTLCSDEEGVLFLDLSSASHGVFQTLSNELTKSFGWSISLENVRSWLIGISNQAGETRLTLVLDGVEPDSSRLELDELISDVYGSGLRIVVAVDETQIERLRKNSTGRHLTRLGRLSRVVQVPPLDDEEMQATVCTLHRQRIGFMRGAERSHEYRTPWVLRAIAGNLKRDPEYQDEALQAMIPSMAGMMLIDYTRNRFGDDELLIAQFITLAEALLEDLDTRGQSIAVSLTSVGSYVCHTKTARERLGDAEFTSLIERGYLKHSILEEGERIVVPQVPELMLVALPIVLAKRLLQELRDEGAKKATTRLVRRCASLFAGDLIGARTIVEAASCQGGLTMEVFNRLLADQPKRRPVTPGMHAAMLWEGDLKIELQFGEDGKFTMIAPDGTRHTARVDEPDNEMLGNYTSWLMLSHLAALQIGVTRAGQETIEGPIDPELLLEVGSCPYPLRAPMPGLIENMREHPLPDHGSVVCHKEGIVEPITLALMMTISRDRERAKYIVQEALDRGNLALLSRIHVALDVLVRSSETDKASWASEVIIKKIGPALSGHDLLH